jgi:hypothetical protein
MSETTIWPMGERRQVATLLLAFASALVAHWLGYAVAQGPAALHEYLAPTMTLAVPVGLVTMLVLVVRGARALDWDGDPLIVRRLIALQLGVYAALEIYERVVGGTSIVDLLTEPAVLAGLVAQPVVALVVVGCLRAGQTVIRRVLERFRAGLVGPQPVRCLMSASTGIVVVPSFRSPLSRRGPPLVR